MIWSLLSHLWLESHEKALALPEKGIGNSFLLFLQDPGQQLQLWRGVASLNSLRRDDLILLCFISVPSTHLLSECTHHTALALLALSAVSQGKWCALGGQRLRLMSFEGAALNPQHIFVSSRQLAWHRVSSRCGDGRGDCWINEWNDGMNE